MLSKYDFIKLKGIVERYAGDFISRKKLPYEIFAIFLYGGAAKYHVGKKESYDDFDLNIFFKPIPERGISKSIRRSISTQRPKTICGGYKNKKVEVMRTEYHDSGQNTLEAVKAFAKSHKSERWNRIAPEPVIFLYPRFKVLNNLL